MTHAIDESMQQRRAKLQPKGNPPKGNIQNVVKKKQKPSEEEKKEKKKGGGESCRSIFSFRNPLNLDNYLL